MIGVLVNGKLKKTLEVLLGAVVVLAIAGWLSWFISEEPARYENPYPN